MGYKRGTARNFLHSFPLSGTPVVQSYWAWKIQVPEKVLRVTNPVKNYHLNSYRVSARQSVALSCLVAFHPRPQIASDLGRNGTRSFNPHRNRNQFPSGNEILAYGRRFKSQPASTRCDFENRKPNPPLFTGDLNSPNRKPAGRNRRIRAAKRPQIAESPATRPLSCLAQVPVRKR